MPIDLRDYSRTAAQRGWGAGWPSCSGAKAAGTAVVTADRSGVRMSVHKRIARLVDLLIDHTERRDYLLRVGQCGGYNCRAISGTSTASNHSWGLAVDINWQTNPYVRPRKIDMPSWLPLLWNRYGFAWGGNYGNDGTTGKADSMHFEFMGTPEQADEMTALALRELTAAPQQEDPLMALSDAEQRELLDTTRKLAGWLSMPSFTPPGGDPSKPWSVTPGAAILNTYVGMFYGGSSTGNKSLFQTAAATGGPVDTAAIVAGVVDAITRQGLAKPVADELARRLAS